jgi:tRNA pseudouridine55 synthase
MKIFKDGKVYVQKNDMVYVNHSDMAIPASIFMKLFGNGIVIIDKPKGYTSREIVDIVGKNYKTRKVGHTGTLDPLATGVLVICIGKATKIVELITSYDKEYIATFKFGVLTDSLDSEGNIINDNKIILEEEHIKRALKELTGTYMQEVPIYSAVRINGKKLYEYAREGLEVELPKHEVTISSLELLNISEEDGHTIIKVKCHVSKGTYIRSLGNDIDGACGQLRRKVIQGKTSLD